MTMLKLDYERDDRTVLNIDDFKSEIIDWNRFGTATVCSNYEDIPVFINEFWTSKQRAAHSLHEISYRACFKPQLPRFFITRLTKKMTVCLTPLWVEVQHYLRLLCMAGKQQEMMLILYHECWLRQDLPHPHYKKYKNV